MAPCFQDDERVVLAAVGSNGLALEYASPEWQADAHVAREAVAKDGRALQFVDKALRRDARLVVTLSCE